jgi:hypothetical protein
MLEHGFDEVVGADQAEERFDPTVMIAAWTTISCACACLHAEEGG